VGSSSCFIPARSHSPTCTPYSTFVQYCTVPVPGASSHAWSQMIGQQLQTKMQGPNPKQHNTQHLRSSCFARQQTEQNKCCPVSVSGMPTTAFLPVAIDVRLEIETVNFMLSRYYSTVYCLHFRPLCKKFGGVSESGKLNSAPRAKSSPIRSGLELSLNLRREQQDRI
jgi:hypothetical protein